MNFTVLNDILDLFSMFYSIHRKILLYFELLHFKLLHYNINIYYYNN